MHNSSAVRPGGERPSLYPRLNADSAIVIALVPLAALAGLLLNRAAGADYLFLTFSLVVAVGALYGGFWLAVVAIATAALVVDYFILGPGALLSFGSSVDAVALAVFV